MGTAFGQASTTSRPRVAATPTPPVIQNDPYATSSANNQGRPPTLIGGTNRPQPSATATPVIDDEDEINVATTAVKRFETDFGVPIAICFASGLPRSGRIRQTSETCIPIDRYLSKDAPGVRMAPTGSGMRRPIADHFADEDGVR